MKRHLEHPSYPTEDRDEARKKQEDEWLCPEKAAPYLRVCTSFLAKRRQEKHPHLMRQGPPFYKIGGRIWYKRSDLDRWREARRVDPAGPADG